MRRFQLVFIAYRQKSRACFSAPGSPLYNYAIHVGYVSIAVMNLRPRDAEDRIGKIDSAGIAPLPKWDRRLHGLEAPEGRAGKGTAD